MSIRQRTIRLLATIIILVALPPTGFAVTGVNPTGVNINSSGVTSVFLTFQNLGPNEQPVDAFWCGDVVATGVTSFDPCTPGTLFGRLPVRNNLSQASGTGGIRNLSDVMTIPQSVARRAYQDAQRGNPSDFFYVRRFTDGVTDTFVTVTCRMAGGGARVPLALTEVRVAFDTPEGQRPYYFMASDQPLPAFGAQLQYNGAGRLKGRWELVKPGDTEPTFEDLLTEASLPAEQRGLQNRYTLIERFDVFLPPAGKFFLAGPDPALVARAVDGPYKILLRVEATDEKEGNSDTLSGVVASGGVAGFPMPVLQFFTGEPETLAAAQDAITKGTMSLLLPGADAQVGSGMPVSFSWLTIPGAVVYRLEVSNDDGEVLNAVVPAGVASYNSPPWALASAGDRVRWRIVALGGTGQTLGRSEWRELRVAGSVPNDSEAAGAPAVIGE
jgi:hypothetical protein